MNVRISVWAQAVIVLGEGLEVELTGQVLAKEPVGVLVAAARSAASAVPATEGEDERCDLTVSVKRTPGSAEQVRRGVGRGSGLSSQLWMWVCSGRLLEESPT
jgi:hypothetical protein